ncbi:MAG: TerB family tellurite resistance protein, partial [Polyangiaceae bacterium]
VVRYIVIVAVLLTRIAFADGRVAQSEVDRVCALFRHIDRIPPSRIDSFWHSLMEHVPKLSDHECSLCFRELKALCNAEERFQVMRLLASQAIADGDIHPSEHSELMAIAYELDVPARDIEELATEVLASSRVSFPSDAGKSPGNDDSDGAGDVPTAAAESNATTDKQS